MTSQSDISALSPSRRRLGQFLLDPVERRVARYSVEQSGTIRELFDAAVAHDEAARALLDDDDLALSAELASAAARLYVRARLASELPPNELSKLSEEDAWEEFDRLRETEKFPPAPAEFETARSVLAARNAVAWSRLPVEEGLTKARSFGPALEWLRGLVEPRSLAEVRYQKWRRIVAAGIFITAFASWSLYSILKPKNLALHKAVTQSSSHPRSTAVPGGLVDGSVDEAYGVHTGNDSPPWVMVDLGSSHKIGSIKIYNRGDGWFDESLPLALELSEDGTNFKEIDRRTTSFGQYSPWKIRLDAVPARWVRVKGKDGGVVVLNELEVYAK
jgi:hypothetical protein